MRKTLITTLLLFCLSLNVYAKKDPVDYVNPMIGTHDSRPMQFPGPAMPFGMVKFSPDNQKSGWKAAHDYNIKNIAGFNFFHDYQMSGIYVLPITGKIQTEPGPENNPSLGYRSRISNSTEIAEPGYYSVFLEDYRVKAELSATNRVGVQRYTFPASNESAIMFDFDVPYEDPDNVIGVKITKVSDNQIEGYIDIVGGQNNGRTIHLVKQYKYYFVSKFSKPFESLGGWQEDKITENIKEFTGKGNTGCFLRYKTEEGEQITVLTGFSLVSLEQARLNFNTETKEFGFNFDKYRANGRKVWNNLLGKIKVEGNNETDKIKFYTNLYRTYCTRTVWSDVDGKWMDMNEEVQQSPNGGPIYSSDAFWGMKWNLNGLWSLVNPSLMNEWIVSLIEYYKIGGWLPKGPTAGEYTAIMTGSPAVSMIVAAYQQGIRNYDVELAYESIKHIMMNQGEVHKSGSYVGNRWLKTYMDHGYVPVEYGHASGALELAFQDWCVAQMAKSLGKMEDYKYFLDRSLTYKNHMDPKVGYARPRFSSGEWVEPFSAFSSLSWVEGNGWQYTFHAPHDMQGVINLVGREEYIKRLDWGFEESKKSLFNAKGDQYAKYPINHGNQPNMQAAFLFHYAGEPWKSQHWSREILDTYYGATPTHGWPGDEDEGQMGAWYVMSSMGLFQMQGGCGINPIYEIGSPNFNKITISLENGKKIRITAKNNNKENHYVQSAKLNGKPLNKSWIYVSDIQNGGELEFVMGAEPNKLWGTELLPPSESKPGEWKNENINFVIKSSNLKDKMQHKFLDYSIVEMESEYADYQIRYTTDGSTPNSSSTIYTAPFKVTNTTLIKARLFNKEGDVVGPKRSVKLEKIDYENNLTTGEKATASKSNTREGSPDKAIDGYVDINKFWDASPAPQWWQVELSKIKEIKEAHLFTYWGDGRVYKYNIEVSTDGEEWKTIVDASNNSIRSSNKGYKHKFAPVEAKFIRVNMLNNSANPGVHIVEFRLY